MASPSDIRDEGLRELFETAFADMRAGDGTAAVKTLVSAFEQYVETYPEVMEDKITMRDREIPKLMRWPGLGANLDMPSLMEGRIVVNYARERFSVSEAMTYYQFLLDEILQREKEQH